MQKITKELEISGIYIITNKINGNRYIGSSNNIRRRLWKHRSLLRHNKHENSHLQNAWNKYTENNFIYSILEICEIKNLLDREQYYIDLLKPEYNIDISTKHKDFSPETRKLMKENRNKCLNEGSIKLSCKEIHQYDLDGNYLQTFNSVKEAAKSANIHTCTIQRYISGKFKHGGNYLWSFEKLDKLPKYVKTKRPYKSLKKIHVYNDTEEYIFDGAKECSEYFKVHIVSVRGAILHKRKFLNKYIIKYLAP